MSGLRRGMSDSGVKWGFRCRRPLGLSGMRVTPLSSRLVRSVSDSNRCACALAHHMRSRGRLIAGVKNSFMYGPAACSLLPCLLRRLLF